MRTLFFATSALLLFSCGSVRVNYDYDSQTDFTYYKTYDYFENMRTGLSELDTKRLIKLVDSIMRSRGITYSETPDFYIDIQSESYRSPNRNTVGVGVGGTGRNVGGGVSVGIPVGGGLSREIVFDFVDAKRNDLFWQAVSESNYRENASPDQREAKLREVVIKVMEGFPPR